MRKRNKDKWVLTDGEHYYSFDIAKARRGYLQLSIARESSATQCPTVIARRLIWTYGHSMPGFFFVLYDPLKKRMKSMTAMNTCEPATTKAQTAKNPRHADRTKDLSASVLNSSSRNARPFIVMDDTVNKCACFPKSTSFSIPASSSSSTNGRSSFETLKFRSCVALVKMAIYFLIAASLLLSGAIWFVFILVCYELFK
jgi:hypothetical protein